MADFIYIVRVTCADEGEADQVMGERLGPDEDYGFEYTVEFKRPRDLQAAVALL
jgi:hypothetical protein